MPIHWKPFLAPSTLALKFAIKTLLAGGLALWCAFRFDLEQPQWALMTVLIVSQPLSGMVVAKGLFRLLGTLVGTAMSVLMIALFAQAPWLFLLAISLWLGLCTAASTSLRNHVSYAFVLSGYTVAIIGLPAVDQPLLVFEQAVARCTEICLGIICASAVSAILWPQRVEQNLDKQAHTTWLLGMQAARGEIDPRQRQPQGLLNALSKIVEVDAQRDHAWFEGERGRRRAGALALLS
ncbi:FUSC family protein, partial [Pseudomonas aeruginosa]|nr:FUSC family protein [Pseudomonas aeruginosa]